MAEDGISTERAAEIDRVNRWNDRLEETWEETMKSAPLTLKLEYIHKFVTSFNTLSRARRDLRGLDQPKRVSVQDERQNDTPPASIDQEVEKLTKSLSLNDKNYASN